MPTPTKGARLGGSPSHQRLILSNLATSLFEHGSITTTQAKAKRLQPLAESLITKAKRGDLNSRRQVMKTIRDKSVVHVLFTEISERFAERPGGYTRVTKLGPRKGDNAPMVQIELVESMADAAMAKPAKKAAEKKTAKKADEAEKVETAETAEAAEVAEAPAEETAAAEAPVEETPAAEGVTDKDGEKADDDK